MVLLLQDAGLPGWLDNPKFMGNPDFVWPQLNVALFVNGCFWHGHECGRNLTPRTNAGAWRDKINTTMKRDRKTDRELRAIGWSVLRIWECQLKRQPEFCITRIKGVLSRRRNNG